MTEATLIGDAPTATAAAPAPGGDQTPPTQQPQGGAATAPADDPLKPAAAPAASAPVERSAPEKYEFKFADQAAAVDPEILGAFEAKARELKMPQDEAQQMVEALAPKIQARVAAQQALYAAQASAKWTTDAKADSEFGGDKLTENLALGEKALSSFGTPALRQLLVESQFGNHPEVIRFMVRAGKALSEDKFVPGRTSAPVDPLKAMYPSMHKD